MELRALHGHNSRRPDGYLGFQRNRIENVFDSSQVADCHSNAVGKFNVRFFSEVQI